MAARLPVPPRPKLDEVQRAARLSEVQRLDALSGFGRADPAAGQRDGIDRRPLPKPPPIPTYALEGLPPSGETGRQLAQRPDADRSRVALSPQAGDRRSRLKVATSLGFGLFVAAGLSTTLGISVLWLLQERGDGVAPRSQKAQGAPPVKMVKATQVPTIPPVERETSAEADPSQRAASIRPVDAGEADTRPGTTASGSKAPASAMPKLGVGRVEYRSASSDWVVPIEVDTAGAPAGDLIVAITDLPQGARLNRGKPTADGSWFIEPDETAGLTLRLPDTAEADRLSIALVTGMGRPLARATPRIEPRSEPRPEPKPSSATEREARPDAQQAEPTSSPFGKNRVEDIARVLFERGEARLAEGDVIGARMFFTKAAAEGDAQAAIAIGATYDPSLFQSLEVRGMKPDLQMARHWYRRAIELGSKDAYERLERLADK